METRQSFDKKAYMEDAKANRQKCYDMAEEMALTVGRVPAMLRSFLDKLAELPLYTANNVLIIMKQKPDATYLGEYKYWKGKNVHLKNDEYERPVYILERGNEYQKKDGSIGVYFNAKKVYDVTQTTANFNYKKTYPSIQELITILANKSPVPFKNVEANELPDGMFVYYDSIQNVIKKKSNLGMSDTVFQLVAMEIAHSIIAQGSYNYNHEEAHMTAYCASYVVCKQFGVNTDNYEFDFRIANENGKSYGVKKELNAIKNTASKVFELIDRNLEKPSRNYER